MRHRPGDGCGDWDSTQPTGYHMLQPKQTCWFEPYMPDLDYENLDALTRDDRRRALLGARRRRRRLPRRRGQALPAARRRIACAPSCTTQFEHAEPLFYLVGETFNGDRNLINSFIGPTALDAQFDFPLYFAIGSALGSYRGLDARSRERDRRVGHGVRHGADVAVPRQPRRRALLVDVGQRRQRSQATRGPRRRRRRRRRIAYFKLRLALTFVATSPGVPLIYYGDEYGQPGAGDPDNRRFMKWTRLLTPFEQATLDVTKKLGAARKELVALRRGDRKTLWVDDDHYVFARDDSEQGRRHRRASTATSTRRRAGGAGAVVRAARRRHGAQGSARRPAR